MFATGVRFQNSWKPSAGLLKISHAAFSSGGPVGLYSEPCPIAARLKEQVIAIHHVQQRHLFTPLKKLMTDLFFPGHSGCNPVPSQ
jgi:hypothetical protein